MALRKLTAAVERGDRKALEQVVTPEALQLLDALGEKAWESMRNDIKQKGGIKSTSHTIDGDTAVVHVTYGNGETGTTRMQKVDGKWKAGLEK